MFIKMIKNGLLWRGFFKTWALRSNSVTRHVNFKRPKIDRKRQNWKIRMRHFEWFSNNVESTLLCLWSTYREVDIGNWWSSCHQNLDNLCMSCPCCQVKWAGTLVVGAITRGFIAKQQLHDVSVKTKKGEWLKKENSKPNFSSLWNSNTNASCIFFFWWILKLEEELESRTIPKVHFLSKKFISKSTKITL